MHCLSKAKLRSDGKTYVLSEISVISAVRLDCMLLIIYSQQSSATNRMSCSDRIEKANVATTTVIHNSARQIGIISARYNEK
jgi:hypothetical protein